MSSCLHHLFLILNFVWKLLFFEVFLLKFRKLGIDVRWKWLSFEVFLLSSIYGIEFQKIYIFRHIFLSIILKNLFQIKFQKFTFLDISSCRYYYLWLSIINQSVVRTNYLLVERRIENYLVSQVKKHIVVVVFLNKDFYWTKSVSLNLL